MFYILRSILQYKASGNDQPLNAYLSDRIKLVSRTYGLSDSPQSIEELQLTFKCLFPSIDNLSEVSRDWFDPTLAVPIGYTNEISQKLSLFRDEHMLDLISRAVKSSERVFAVVGSAHIVMQERVLREALNKK